MSNGPSNPASAYRFSIIRDRLRRHPGTTLDFALGRWREPPPEWLPRFVNEHAALVLSRRSDEELETLVGAAIDMFDRVYRLRVAPDQVLAAPSGRAAMSALAAVCIDSGDTVVVTEPGYPAFARLAAQRQARLAVMALDPLRGFAPDLSRLDLAQDPLSIRLAALNYPNNPTGSIIGPPALATLRQRLGNGALLFNDATYGPLTFGRTPVSLLGSEYDRAADDLIELHSLGKPFSLGPLGVAFLIGPPRPIAEIGAYGDHVWTQLNSLQARAAAACLEDLGYLERRRTDLERRLVALQEVVSRLGFVPYPVEAGMYVLCRAPSSVGGRRVANASAAADALLERHGLAVAPWDVESRGYVRFSAAFTTEELEALEALGRIVD